MKEIKTGLWGNLPLFEEDVFSDRKAISKTKENNRETTVRVLETQKSYIWMRLFLNDPHETINKGDIVRMTYLESGEFLDVVFASYEKSKLHKNNEGEDVTHYSDEDDKKTLCLMVDIDAVNIATNIPFIRTLFKGGRYYEFQLLKTSELEFAILDDKGDKKELLKFFSVTF